MSITSSANTKNGEHTPDDTRGGVKQEPTMKSRLTTILTCRHPIVSSKKELHPPSSNLYSGLSSGRFSEEGHKPAGFKPSVDI